MFLDADVAALTDDLEGPAADVNLGDLTGLERRPEALGLLLELEDQLHRVRPVFEARVVVDDARACIRSASEKRLARFERLALGCMKKEPFVSMFQDPKHLHLFAPL